MATTATRQGYSVLQPADVAARLKGSSVLCSGCNAYAIFSAVAARRAVRGLGRDDSFELIREREWKGNDDAPPKPSPEPTYGVLLWVEPR